MLNPELFHSLCCPETHQPISPVSAATLKELNERIATGQVRNRRGDAIKESVENGLIRQDGQSLYPIRNNLPLLLIEEAIPLTK